MSDAEFDVFLSYNSRDHVIVRRIADELRQQNVTCFLDRWYLQPGQDWVAALESALQRSKAMAFLVGPGEFGRWQQRERAWALDHLASRGDQFPLIPVLLPGSTPPSGFLQQLMWLDFRRDGSPDQLTTEWTSQLKRLAEAVRSPSALVSDSTRGACPFPGLRAFQEEEAALFFGRDQYIDELLQLVKDKHSIIAVVGASGSGKSSVVRAGLLPKLRKTSPGQTVWELLVLTPGSDPLLSLARAFQPLVRPDVEIREDQKVQIRDRRNRLLAGELNLSDLVDTALEEQPGTNRMLLVVDQWEELYTECTDQSLREQFLQQVLSVGTQSKSSLQVLLTVRADFYHYLHNNRQLLDELKHSRLDIGAMNREELQQVIEQPAAVSGLKFESGLVERILDEAEREPGSLPLLEFLLSQLWGRMQGDTITHADYRNAGQLPGAIAAHAEELYSQLIRQGQSDTVFVQLFRRLVNAGVESSKDTRRRVFVSALTPAEATIAKEFIDGRLLISSVTQVQNVPQATDASVAQDGGEPQEFTAHGEATVEVAHEELLRRWDRLKDWVNADREFLRWRTWLKSQIEEYQTNGRLLDWQRLKEAKVKGFYPARREDVSDEGLKLLKGSVRRMRIWQLAIAASCLVIWFGYMWTRTRNTVDSLLSGTPAAVPFQLDQLRGVSWLTNGRLRDELQSELQQHRLRAAYALAEFSPTADLLDLFVDELDRVPLSESLPYIAALKDLQDAFPQEVRSRFRGLLPEDLREDKLQEPQSDQSVAPSKLSARAIRALSVLLSVGHVDDAAVICKPQNDPSWMTQLIREMPGEMFDSKSLIDLLPKKSLKPKANQDVQYALCLMLGEHGDRNDWDLQQVLKDLYQTSSSSGVHAAAGWSLQQMGSSIADLEAMVENQTEKKAGTAGDDSESSVRDWYVTDPVQGADSESMPGFTFVRIREYPEFALGAVSGDGKDKDPGQEDPRSWTAEDKKPVEDFWLADREVTAGQFLAVMSRAYPEGFRQHPLFVGTDPDAQVDPADYPARYVNWYEAILFCNALSDAHDIDPYYRFDPEHYVWRDENENGDLTLDGKFPQVIGGPGYRLPGEREWEYACRALSSVDYSFGSSSKASQELQRYGVVNEALIGVGARRPNRWGCFDLHGSVREWCFDPRDSQATGRGVSRVLRGGAFLDFPDDLRSACRNDYTPDGRYDFVVGFRISRTK